MPKSKKSIAVLACYIGKLPWYFDYFIHSCKYNQSINFIIVTDDIGYRADLPRNVKIVPKTLDQLNSLARERLSLPVRITTGYKLCDFKPTYGVLFSDLLQGYEYWAHADIDIIFGNIRGFITDELLENFDLISVRHDFLTGQFLLFRNNERTKRLYTHSRDYQKVLCSEAHYCFDETNFRWDEFTEGKSYREISSDIESMTHVAKRLQSEGYLKVHFDFMILEGIPGRIKWKNGKLYYKNKYEALLYHLVLFKNCCVPPKKISAYTKVIRISSTRFY